MGSALPQRNGERDGQPSTGGSLTFLNICVTVTSADDLPATQFPLTSGASGLQWESL